MVRSNVSLYNKYRPKTFSDVVGQETIVKTMMNALASKNIAGAYLLCGPRGTGKTTCARVFAKSILCLDEKRSSSDGCNKCVSCKQFDAGVHNDFLEVDAATNRSIDNIRSIKESINLAPSISHHRVVLIDEVHRLTPDATTALLKVLEEPPDGVVFLLATTDLQKIPSTIRSRCQLLRFRSLSARDISERLTYVLGAERKQAESEAINMIARGANGALRDALSTLDMMLTYAGDQKLTVDIVKRVVGTPTDEIVCELVDAILTGRGTECVGFTSRNTLDVEPKDVMSSLVSMLSSALIVKVCGRDAVVALEGLSGRPLDSVCSIAKTWDTTRIQGAIDYIEHGMWKFDVTTLPQHHVFNEIIAVVVDPLLAPSTLSLSSSDKMSIEALESKVTAVADGMSILIDMQKRLVKQIAEIKKSPR